jgi:prepilin-type N-terminal cleavage/methylation domain-containing protein
MFKNQSGYSLIEITVTVAIFALVFILGANFIITGFRSMTFGSEQETAIQNARRAMENLAKDIREAKSSEKGDYPLSVTEEQNFTWYGDVDNDGVAEKIKYFLLSSTLQRVIVEPGAGNLYSGPGATTTIAQYVNNQAEPIFTYYDASNNETDEINNIRLINIKLKINVTPERAPLDYYLETDIQLRNLKDNL